MTGKEQKAQQRRLGIAARKGLSAELSVKCSNAISEKLIALDVYKSAQTIISYQAFGGEVDLTFFHQKAEADAKRVAFPITGENGSIIAAIPQGDSAWEVGKYGIRTPIAGRSLIICPTEIDLVIVPCTVFSSTKLMRIGMGAGYYDRFLPRCSRAMSVAVAFEAQKLDDIWVDSWDVALDWIVTERAVYGGA